MTNSKSLIIVITYDPNISTFEDCLKLAFEKAGEGAELFVASSEKDLLKTGLMKFEATFIL